MKTTTVLLALLLATGTAYAGGQDGSIGVGAEYGITSVTLGGGGLGGGGQTFGVGGPSVNYDAGKFHVGGFLAVYDPEGADNTTFSVGGRFYYHVHSTAMSDFSIGGTLGMLSFDAGPDRDTLVYIEPGVQIRAFVASNVALSFNVGLAIGAADAGGVTLAGQATGTAGVHYYFF